MNILLIEDDERISNFLVKGLFENGHTIKLAQTGEEAREIIQHYQFDIILMDIMLPGIDGIQLTQLIRFKKNFTPILVLSALNSPEDKVKILDIGADDYLSKPFHFEELLSRINALTRRTRQFFKEEERQLLTIHNVSVDTEQYKAFQNNIELNLSPKEYKLLHFLLINKNKVVTRTQIMQNVWGIDFDSNTNVLDVYMSYVRNKLDESEYKIIHTVKGVGYMIKD
ncbi:response regulator transcription factor [Chryseobacterium sp. T1]